jgi:hypothetical protein
MAVVQDGMQNKMQSMSRLSTEALMIEKEPQAAVVAIKSKSSTLDHRPFSNQV